MILKCSCPVSQLMLNDRPPVQSYILVSFVKRVALQRKFKLELLASFLQSHSLLTTKEHKIYRIHHNLFPPNDMEIKLSHHHGPHFPDSINNNDPFPKLSIKKIQPKHNDISSALYCGDTHFLGLRSKHIFVSIRAAINAA